MRTAIIGGGIAGLAAACELEKARAVRTGDSPVTNLDDCGRFRTIAGHEVIELVRGFSATCSRNGGALPLPQGER